MKFEIENVKLKTENVGTVCWSAPLAGGHLGKLGGLSLVDVVVVETSNEGDPLPPIG